ncbi:hypothetical protein D9M68_918100 [compost metagenome]
MGAAAADTGHRGWTDQYTAGAGGEQEVQFLAGGFAVRQVDGAGRELAAVPEAIFIGDPHIERVEQRLDGFRLVLQTFLDDRGQSRQDDGRVDPLLVHYLEVLGTVVKGRARGDRGATVLAQR